MMIKKKLFSLPLVTHDANSINRSSNNKKELLPGGQHFLSSTPNTGPQPQPQPPTPATLPKPMITPPSIVHMLEEEVEFISSTET